MLHTEDPHILGTTRKKFRHHGDVAVPPYSNTFYCLFYHGDSISHHTALMAV